MGLALLPPGKVCRQAWSSPALISIRAANPLRVIGLTNSTHAQLEFVSTVVDDEHLEEAENIHSDQKSGLVRQVPVRKNMHVAVRDPRTLNLY